MRCLALARAAEIVGDAAAQVSEAGRDGLPAIPWAQVVGMCNRLVHAYFDVNRNILWDTVHRSLPMLIAQLKAATASG
ncbi:MAG: hypothetical protein AW08_03788 [Candidatus Accumulibacter adjunctus]|uniref:DUF86 domain-containing protein n=1 Tax=Candidatus Accumulibacter adjunctus TaxID=1454001 RepID=A0A011M3L2_9PROT|nr:MAG: hypothetical protein AW08_03788 [Candidatus Accumulibacter adjunctus]